MTGGSAGNYAHWERVMSLPWECVGAVTGTGPFIG